MHRPKLATTPRVFETRKSVNPKLLPLFDRPLIMVAHPDDETACTSLLQRARCPAVLFCTDGAPSDEFFWRRFGSRENYAALRRKEAEQALAGLGLEAIYQLHDPRNEEPFRDQELWRELLFAFKALLEAFPALHATAIVAPAYEGGHPDHDACSLLAYLVGKNFKTPVWEMPLYNRSPLGVLIHQQFLSLNGSEVGFCLSSHELRMRAEMLSAYSSQSDAASFINTYIEQFRPQPKYDYSRPPHPGPLNYEHWQWQMAGVQLCQAFQTCISEVALLSEQPPAYPEKSCASHHRAAHSESASHLNSPP